ncbi:SDR family oxidoreductase [Nocardioides cavernae]|uniref:SDR family oxidoreductase n=1 Tax=Nocardioides cavernae TaxID=1921566 RepID=A0ABR8NHK5_9ACTN|nr:SDR family oxidoreductase [Nocardioides cavernae]MBD3926766.1 SDR family oxidoreductase [Nocardioides cavernae]MBM7512488.1 NAD(P)-dependent dehydrogenase (short-subunit alcohol dehydrogenase family) [Nocardioides cavernae]
MTNAVITGSTKGIGFALARELVRRGHSVAVSGRGRDAVDEAVGRLRPEATGDAAVIGVPTDVTDPTQVQALWEAAASAFGSVDLWVNNAGVAYTNRTILETTPEEVATMVGTNMLGTIHGAQVAVRSMTAAGRGQVFNILGGGSDGSVRPGMGVYSSTKRGLDQFTRALVKEVDGTAVRVGQVRPGILISDGWLREAASHPDAVASQRRMVNILSDHVDDVAPFLVDQMLASRKNGAEIAWLTSGRMMRKFLRGAKDDKLARYGL